MPSLRRGCPPPPGVSTAAPPWTIDVSLFGLIHLKALIRSTNTAPNIFVSSADGVTFHVDSACPSSPFRCFSFFPGGQVNSEAIFCKQCFNYNGQVCVTAQDCNGNYCLFGTLTFPIDTAKNRRGTPNERGSDDEEDLCQPAVLSVPGRVLPDHDESV